MKKKKRMKTVGSVRTYKFGLKNNWRRTIANEVLRRTAGRERREMVLYLAGPEDNDRSVLIEKGVPRRNLIAIDRDSSNVDKIRDNKGQAMAAEAADVLWSWPTDWPVCAVILDFCCGLNQNAIQCYKALQCPSLVHAIVVMNFMRGRDPASNEIRALVQRMGGLGKDELNRAKILMRFIAAGLSIDLWDDQSLTFEQWHAKRREFVDKFEGWLKPSYFSYRSGGLVFDSVVFQCPTRLVFDADPAFWTTDKHRDRHQMVSPDTARKIAAQRALRTMRIRGTFPVAKHG